jgi:hypothetical protein
METVAHTNNRMNARDQRGAALISTLLISALLLTAGGMLILTTAMTGTNTIDAAAEMEAYYGAEAGLQATLNVLRGNVMPTPLFVANPAGGVAPQNRIDFAKASTKSTSNLAGDPASADARLSRWLTYNYTSPGSAYADRVAVNPGYNPFNGVAYSIKITRDNTPAALPPRRMIVESTGYGPRGAKKILSMLVSANGLDITVPAPLVIRGHDNAATVLTIQLGNSNSKTYSGVDHAVPAEAQKPTLAISGHDVATVQGAYAAKPNTVAGDDVTNPHKFNVLDIAGNTGPAGSTLVEPPWFLKTADDARAFLVQAEALANQCAAPANPVGSACPKRGVILNSLNGYAGTAASPQFTIVKGDCTLDGGAGLLIVTGTVTFNGPGPNFNGVILVMGTGRLVKTGGGNRDVFGSVMVARFGATGGFLNPTFDYGTGAGSSNLQYDSRAVMDAITIPGAQVLGIKEK